VATAGKRSQVLIGRASELAELDRGLDRLGAGRPWFVQIVGEPGIGKSRLLLELARRAKARGYLMLAGRAAEFEQDLPFAVLRDACNDYLGSIDQRLLVSLRSETLAELAAVFPSLGGVGPPALRQGMGDDRYRTHYAIRALLEWLAARQPTVVALDDVHWADAASVEVIAHLLRRFRGPVLGALAVRQRPARLAAVLDGATRTGYGARIELAPLTATEAESLMDPGLDADERAILYRRAGATRSTLSSCPAPLCPPVAATGSRTRVQPMGGGRRRRSRHPSGRSFPGWPPRLVRPLMPRPLPVNRSSLNSSRRLLSGRNQSRSPLLTNCSPSTSYGPPRRPGGFVSVIRSCAGSSTTSCRGPGGSAPTRVRPQR
jgi:hypothetical protein